MKKVKIVNLTTYIIAGILVILALILGFVFHFDIRFYYATVLLLLVTLGLIMLIGILIKEWIEITYDSPRFNPVMYAFNLILGVGLYYLVKYVNYYDTYYFLYWIGALVAGVTPEIICLILNKKFKKDKNDKGPRIAVNRR